MDISNAIGWKIHFDPSEENAEVISSIQKKLSDFGVDFKTLQGGEAGGKYFTAYPQSLEKRDDLIKYLEQPEIKKLLKAQDAVEGNFNITDTISGRFTTGYVAHDKFGQPIFGKTVGAPNEGLAGKTAAKNGKINRFIKDSWGMTDEASGSFSGYFRYQHAQQVEDALALHSQHPEIFELMMGKSGYVSPYEQVYPDNVKNFFEAVGKNSSKVKKNITKAEAVISKTASTADESIESLTGAIEDIVDDVGEVIFEARRKCI